MPHPPQIPLTPQTDERNFPRHDPGAAPGKSGHPYPKMLTRICTREDRSAWIEANRRVDQTTRQDYWESTPPRVNAPIPMLTTQDMVDEGLCDLAGQPIIVQDKEQEARVRAFLGLDEPLPPPKSVAIPVAAAVPNAVNHDGWVDEAAPKKRGRPRKNKPVDVSN